MDKSHPPTTFGVFKPVGHTVIAYRSSADADAGVAALATRGFEPSALVRYTAQEMVALVEAERLTASPLAGFGYEPELNRIHLELGQQGCSFVVVHCPKNEQAAQVADIARATHAILAHHYNTLVIEEVTGLQPADSPTP
jgi:hypothetical protein